MALIGHIPGHPGADRLRVGPPPTEAAQAQATEGLVQWMRQGASAQV
jgi:hypothetical protein